MRESLCYLKQGVSPSHNSVGQISTQNSEAYGNNKCPREHNLENCLYKLFFGSRQSQWVNLPEGVITIIFNKLLNSNTHLNVRSNYKDFVSARCVCSSWREIGKKLSGNIIWSDGQIRLPEQLATLCPPSKCGGCIYTYVRRFRGDEADGQPPKYQMYLGRNYLSGERKFLLTAIKTSVRGEFVIYVTKGGGHDGLPPIARILWNSFLRKYQVYMENRNQIGDYYTKPKRQLLGTTKWSPSWTNLLNTILLRPRIQSATFLNVVSNPTALHRGKVVYPRYPLRQNLDFRLNEVYAFPICTQMHTYNDGDSDVEGEEDAETEHLFQSNGLVSSGKVKLVRRMPYWNKYSKCWEQEMWGRAKMSSQKNVQFYVVDDEDKRIAIQFGKAEHDIYVLDFNPCMLTAIQAFAIGLAQFSKSK
eukprot:TRINITY_DN2581_c0_g1_i2.p1 TRINITY_DN2581_c0_g1~~TRINITY_DN2581_c0_g1_i2.p1  ORF type:complete len:444 (-),score=35.43 TRINITY_DN2581_c0_g1_i2:148-1398(-)